MKNQNKLLLIISVVGSLSQIAKADGFFHSVGNVATLGEMDRAEKRQDKRKQEKEAKKNKQAKKNKKSKKVNEYYS